MRTMMKKTITVAAVAVFAGALPVSAEMTTDTPRSDKARELKAQAEALFSQPKQWKKAVRLLEQSASMRDAGDPEIYSCLLYAARIQANLGDMDGAQQNLQKAADHAIARGSVVEAAHALIDAAHVAVANNDGQAAREMVERAKLLTASPLLTPEQRNQITRRIEV